MWIARNKGGKRLFGFSEEPKKLGNGWDSRGKGWVELNPSWCDRVTYDKSPVKIRGIVPQRGI